MRFLRTLGSAFPSLALLLGCKTSPTETPPPASTPPKPTTTTTSAPPKATPDVTAATAALPSAAATSPERPVSADERAADADGERAFAARLYGALAKKEKGNLFVSPTSARMALGMVLAGARGQTARELSTVLGATERSHDVGAVLAAEWAALGSPPSKYDWEKDDIVLLRSANRLFGQKDRPFVPAFVELTGKRYGAPIEAVDFKGHGEATRVLINDWIAKQTADRIKDMLAQPPPPDTKLVLANAIYFKSKWVEPFEKGATKPAPFFAGGPPVTVPMMQITRKRRYGVVDDAHVVELPYGGEGRKDVVMLLVVPMKNDGLADLEKKLDPETLARITRAPSETALVDLAMPRFRIESTLSLESTLAELGAPSVFKFGAADLSGIDGTKELFLGLVLQKTFVDVDEKGTEAAAATVAMARAGGMPQAPPKSVVVRADHPFLFLIRDVVRNRTLFLGRLVAPNP